MSDVRAAGNSAPFFTVFSGAFADELGDDFFGFKAMGIEAETGMSGLSVPRKLFLAKDVQKAKHADVTQG